MFIPEMNVMSITPQSKILKIKLKNTLLWYDTEWYKKSFLKIKD